MRKSKRFPKPCRALAPSGPTSLNACLSNLQISFLQPARLSARLIQPNACSRKFCPKTVLTASWKRSAALRVVPCGTSSTTLTKPFWQITLRTNTRRQSALCSQSLNPATLRPCCRFCRKTSRWKLSCVCCAWKPCRKKSSTISRKRFAPSSCPTLRAVRAGITTNLWPISSTALIDKVRTGSLPHLRNVTVTLRKRSKPSCSPSKTLHAWTTTVFRPCCVRWKKTNWPWPSKGRPIRCAICSSRTCPNVQAR